MTRPLAIALVRLSLALAAAAQRLLTLADRLHPPPPPPRNVFGLEVLVDRPIPMSSGVALGTYLRGSYKHEQAEA